MAMTEIEVPANIEDKGLPGFFSGWKWITSPTGPVIIDFTRVNFIAPYAVTLFAAYYLYLKEVKKKSSRILYAPTSVAGAYLDKSGFLELSGQGSNVIDNYDIDRTVRLTRIRESKDIPKFAQIVMEILAIDDNEVSGAVKYSIIELLRNVIQHALSPIGGIAMAQYYPSNGLVEICVADVGLGIRQTLRDNYPEINTDLKAVKFSTQPHVSRTFTPGLYDTMQDNAGLGLFFIKQITSLAGERFFLASGDSLVSIWSNENGDQRKSFKQAKKGGWQGTFAYLQLQRNSIGEFDVILANCRHLAEEARKYPSELALDFISEVPEIDDLYVVRVSDFEEDVEEAAIIRENEVIPRINSGLMVVLDFDGVDFATQSFIHALMYKIIRDGQQIGSTLSIANCTKSTQEAVMAVAAYAKTNPAK